MFGFLTQIWALKKHMGSGNLVGLYALKRTWPLKIERWRCLIVLDETERGDPDL